MPPDNLSPQEEQDIETELGLSAELSGNDAYLLLKVPDFGNTSFVNATAAVAEGIDPTGISPTVLQSFLRLGAFNYASEPPAAKELLKMIPKGNAASNPSQADPGTQILPGITGLVYVDDVRTRPQDVSGLTTADDHGHGLTATQRQAESGKLYSRGGWRDHSDGNRITTTWGDKVEVVRGNYKMIVLGRQNDPELAMGWEVSGSHVQDYAPGTMPGASYWLEWINDSRYQAPADPNGDGRKGVWLLVNTTENVYEYARKSGNFREEVWGDVHESYTGSDNPPDNAFGTNDSNGSGGHEPPTRLSDRNYDLPGTASNTGRSQPPWTLDNKGMIRSNPHIIEKTWAKRIDSWTGSSSCRVPVISEKTWAVDTYDDTDVSNDVSSKTTVGGSVTETTDVTEDVDSTTTIDGAQTETTTVGGAQTEVTTVGGAKTSVTTVGGVIAENKAAATIFEATEAVIIGELTIAGLKVELEESALHFALEHHLIMDMVFNMAPFKLDIALGRGYELGMKLDDKKIDVSETYLQKKSNALKADHKYLAGTVKALSYGIGL